MTACVSWRTDPGTAQAHALPCTMPRLALITSYRLGHTPTFPAVRADRRRQAILGTAAALAVLGLLAMFQGVVRDSVRQGQLRHEATARHSAATWRCTALASLRQRDDCLAGLNAPPPQVTLLAPRASRP